MTNPTIVGAGLAGLIAAHAWPTARILEAAPAPTQTHRALLRFRSDAVARLTGTEFRRVQVRKGLWSEGTYRAPDIRLANLYAQKVLGAAGLGAERSVWNLAPVERFVAPDTFHEQLLDGAEGRVAWGAPVDFRLESEARRLEAGHGPLISTAPLPVLLNALGMEGVPFHRAPITVERWRVPGADLYQTVYFPDMETSLYRASITGDVLILEYAGNPGETWSIEDTHLAARAFGLEHRELDLEETVAQKYGKIVAIDARVRKELLFKLTHNHGIYSLGRFATWRNILLDDVVQDIEVIKRLLNAGSAYDLRRAAS